MLRLLAAIMKQHHSVPAEPPSLDEESTEERRVEAATAPGQSMYCFPGTQG